MISKEHIYTIIHTPFVIIFTFRIAGYIDKITDILFSELPYQSVLLTEKTKEYAIKVVIYLFAILLVGIHWLWVENRRTLKELEIEQTKSHKKAKKD